MKLIKNLFITQIKGKKIKEKEDVLATEEKFILYLNGKEIFSSSCTPTNYRELLAGFLFSEGIIRKLGDITSIKSEVNKFWIEAKTEPLSSVVSLDAKFSISKDLLFAVTEECQRRGQLYLSTGGAHFASISDSSGVLNFFEDVSRHHGLGKSIGDAFLKKVELRDKFIFTSSRISLNMLLKIARCSIPILASISSPTFEAVEAAKKLGICLIGFVRGKRMNIYSHRWRIKL